MNQIKYFSSRFLPDFGVYKYYLEGAGARAGKIPKIGSQEQPGAGKPGARPFVTGAGKKKL